MSRRTALLLLLMLAALVLGCVQQADLPEDCEASSVQRQASLSGERLDPESIDVCKGQHVSLQISTERAGEIHLHGYDEEAPGVEVESGDTATFAFTATRAGQFVIELHDEAAGSETEVGLLTVHEP